MPSLTGLTSTEVAARLAAGEYNRPPEPGTKSIRAIVRDNLFCVFNIIIGCIILFLLASFLGTRDVRLLWDCSGVFSVAFFNTVIAAVQEIRAKLAMDKVNMLIVREVTALRNGECVSIPHCQIVMGDVIVVKRGDQAVVDGSLLQSHRLEMDESLLTGESEPIEKKEGDTILSGSFCLSGNGAYVVQRLSDSSFASGITRLAQRLKSEVSPLQRQINRIVELLSGVAVVLCILEGSLGLLRHELNVDLVRKLATVLIGLVPQGLVLTASVIFAIGIYRISKVGAVVQTFNAIESFAGVQVICMDKTGTLTQNRMSVRKVTPLAPGFTAASLERLLGTYARLSSEKNATIRALEAFPPDSEAKQVDEFPFSSQRKMSAMTVARDGHETTYALGAFELLVPQCSASSPALSADAIVAQGLQVYRNLLFGEVIDRDKMEPGPDSLGSFRVRPLAIVSISDLVRPDARDVIQQFAGAGIAFKILSGDSAASILATCRDIGWTVDSSEVISGAELEALDGERLEAAVEKSVVFARLRPEQKVKIVQALRARKIHTAMIGDGVNDVPAIKQADLGIAMDEGAPITKEVADIILRQNRFTLLPQVFEEGKKIVNTVGTVARLFLTKNFLVIYLALASSLLLWDFPLTPRRLALFNLFAIGAPAILIAFTNASTDRRKRLVPDLLSFVAISALVMAASGQAGFSMALKEFGPGEIPSMVTVSILVLISVVNFLLIISRRGQKNRGVYLLFAAFMLLVFVPAVSVTASNWLLRFLREFCEISTLDRAAWRIVAVVCAIGSLVLAGAQKLRGELVNRGL
ncbi:MAG: HAD-IC family P-type ATPase [Bryobacteraceae bacterium]|jgi:cation-transporting ATPase E